MTEVKNQTWNKEITIGNFFVPNITVSSNKQETVFWKNAKYLYVSEISKKDSNIYLTLKNETGHKLDTNIEFVNLLISNKLLLPINEDALRAKLILSN